MRKEQALGNLFFLEPQLCCPCGAGDKTKATHLLSKPSSTEPHHQPHSSAEGQSVTHAPLLEKCTALSYPKVLFLFMEMCAFMWMYAMEAQVPTEPRKCQSPGAAELLQWKLGTKLASLQGEHAQYSTTTVLEVPWHLCRKAQWLTAHGQIKLGLWLSYPTPPFFSLFLLRCVLRNLWHFWWFIKLFLMKFWWRQQFYFRNLRTDVSSSVFEKLP